MRAQAPADVPRGCSPLVRGRSPGARARFGTTAAWGTKLQSPRPGKVAWSIGRRRPPPGESGLQSPRPGKVAWSDESGACTDEQTTGCSPLVRGRSPGARRRDDATPQRRHVAVPSSGEGRLEPKGRASHLRGRVDVAVPSSGEGRLERSREPAGRGALASCSPLVRGRSPGARPARDRQPVPSTRCSPLVRGRSPGAQAARENAAAYAMLQSPRPGKVAWSVSDSAGNLDGCRALQSPRPGKVAWSRRHVPRWSPEASSCSPLVRGRSPGAVRAHGQLAGGSVSLQSPRPGKVAWSITATSTGASSTALQSPRPGKVAWSLPGFAIPRRPRWFS